MSRVGRVIGRASESARRSEATDDTLVQRVAAGDLEGLGALYDRHAADLARVAGRLGVRWEMTVDGSRSATWLIEALAD